MGGQSYWDVIIVTPGLMGYCFVTNASIGCQISLLSTFASRNVYVQLLDLGNNTEIKLPLCPEAIDEMTTPNYVEQEIFVRYINYIFVKLEVSTRMVKQSFVVHADLGNLSPRLPSTTKDNCKDVGHLQSCLHYFKRYIYICMYMYNVYVYEQYLWRILQS